MMSVTRPRSALRTGVAPALLAGLVIGLAGCDSGADIGGDDKESSVGRGSDVPEVPTVTTLQNVGKQLDAERRERVKEVVTTVVDPWFEGGFLGEFPRDDYAQAFASFTKGAAADAQRDLDLLSNAGIADRIESATATKRRLRVDVFAYQGRPKGATAHFVLDFKTTGELEESLRIRGDLYLAKDRGEWKIFGYDVDQARPL